MRNVLFSPEVEEDLYSLFRILYDKGYLGTYDFAWSYVQDMVSYIVSNMDAKVKHPAPMYFSRYGHDLSYITYKRNTHTTWYIFFETHDESYLITHITNNHVSGQYIR